MSKVVKGIGKALGGVLSGVKKIFKSVTKSTFGRALLVAGAVYMGGVVMGDWPSPFTALNGMFARAGPAAEELASGVDGIAEGMSGGMKPPGSSYDRMLAAGGNPTSDVPFPPAEEAAANVSGLPTTPTEMINEPSRGLVNSVAEGDDAAIGADMERRSWDKPATPKMSDKLKGILDFLGQGDFTRAALITQGGGLVRGAFAPTPKELAEAQFDARRRYEQQRAADQNANYNVGGVKIMRPAGLINRAMG